MNVLKHMEAIFIAAALVAVPVAYLGKIPDARADSYSISDAAIASGTKMAVVGVSAKRLSAVEKAQLLAADTVTVASRM